MRVVDAKVGRAATHSMELAWAGRVASVLRNMLSIAVLKSVIGNLVFLGRGEDVTRLVEVV